ncbi:MAG: ATP-dependent 6-phosphofructokinase [Desulfobacterales bacterium]|nr:ATP-dependent 6-phosphofructokinase [Desulfobacterales bacterium]
MTQINVLVIDNDADYRKSLAEGLLASEEYEVFEAGGPGEAREILEKELIHLAMIDIRLNDDEDPGDRSGLELAEEIDPVVARILLCEYPPGGIAPGGAFNKTLIPADDRFAEVYFVSKQEDLFVMAEVVERALKEEFEITPVQRVAVLAEGGDAPGMNAAISSVAKVAMHNGVEVMGVEDGFRGLVEDRMRKLRWSSIRDIMGRGGSILGAGRYPKFKNPRIRGKAVDNLIHKKISGLIVIGGVNAMEGARNLAGDMEARGKTLNTVAIPGTINNNLWGTDISVGAASTTDAMIQQIKKVHALADAMRRVFLCKAMGRYCGFLALRSALGSGAQAVVIPERCVETYPSGEDDPGSWIRRVNIRDTVNNGLAHLGEIGRILQKTFASGKRSGFIVVSEAIEILSEGDLDMAKMRKRLEDEIERWKLPNRPDVRIYDLGHAVRGVAPCDLDVWLATRLGAAAVHCLLDGKTNVMVGRIEERGIVDTPFEEVIRMSNRSPAEVWTDRPKWRELYDLHEALIYPLGMRHRLKARRNRFLK